MKELLAAAWRYRHFIVSSIVNDLRSRFARSKLGASWMLLQPLAQVAIFTLVLSQVLSAKLPGLATVYAYPIYLMAGLLAWMLFVEIITRSVSLFVDNANTMKKIMFPRVCLPVIVLGSALVNNVLLALVMGVVFGLLGHELSASLVWLPLLVLVNATFAMSLGLTMGVLNVFLRDIGQVVAVVLQLWFWLTPIVYVLSIVPPEYQRALEFNPMFVVVQAYHEVIVFGNAPDLMAISKLGASSLVLLAFSLLLFRRAAPEMVDVL